MRRISAAAHPAPSVTTTINMPPQIPAADPPVDDTKPDFREYIFGLTPEQWKNHVIYLTRELPKTSINGLGGYLTKLQQPFDLEDIKQAYGGYEFSYILKEGNDICKKCRNASGRFKVEAPPKFDSTRENPGNGAPTNGHNGNDGTSVLLQQFVGVLRDELARSRENGQGSNASEEAIKLLSTASDRAMDVIVKQIPQAGDPTSQLTALLAAAEKLAALRQPPAPAATNSTLERLLEAVLPKLLEKLVTPTDPLEQLTKLATVVEAFDKLRGGDGGGRGGRGDWKTALVEEGIPAARDLVTTLVENRKSQETLAREARLRAEANERTAATARDINEQRIRAAANGGQMQPMNHGTAQDPRTAPNPAPAQAAPAVAHSTFRVVPMNGESVAQPVAAADVPAGAVVVNEDEYLKGVKVRFVELLADDNNTSEMIVDFLRGAYPAFVQNLTKYSAQQVSAYFASDPIVGRVVNTPAWNEWLEDAVNYLQALAKAESEPEPAGRPN